jgi:RNA 2',3'-cyclic 3'-phosphodiesterase
MRLFLAIPLAETIKENLSRLTARHRPSAPDLRWSSPDTWHITLQFLGNTTPEQYDCLLTPLEQLHAQPVSIRFSGFGVFEHAGILHLGIETTSDLLALQKRVIAATIPCGFEPESRPYHPHITLARSKLRAGSRGLRALADRLPDPGHLLHFTAREFLLYESHLSSSGSTYEIRHRFPLAGRSS